MTTPCPADFVADSEDAPASEWAFDFAPLGQIEQTVEGYLRIPAVLAVPGVLKYRDGLELVPESTLQDPDFLKSLENKPVVIEHPTDRQGKLVVVDPTNIAQYRVGTILAPVEYRDNAVRATLQIEDQRGIDAVLRGGLREVSPAYRRVTEPTPGVDPKYGRFDRIQVKRYAGNHNALTRAGRAGSKASLLLGDSALDLPGEKMNPKLIEILGLLQLDPKAYPDDTAAIAAIYDAMKKNLETEIEIEKIPEAIDAVAEAGAGPVEEGAMKMDSKAAGKVLASLNRYADKRASLLGLASKHGVTVAADQGLRQIRRNVATKAVPNFAADSSDALVEAHLQLLANGKPGLTGDSKIAGPLQDQLIGAKVETSQPKRKRNASRDWLKAQKSSDQE